MSDLRVLVLAEDPLARAGLVALLQTEDGINVIGQTSPENTLMDVFQHDIAIIDLGWELDEKLTPLVESPILELDAPLVLLIPDSTYFSQIVTLTNTTTRTAAFAILSRGVPADMLVAALSSTYNGLITFDPTFANAFGNIIAVSEQLDSISIELTPREYEVINLLAEGLPNKTIARRLTISEYTVKFHVNSILTKLNAGSRTEAVVRATRMGLITL